MIFFMSHKKLRRAAMRSTGYLLSSILGAGFLWSLFNPAGQGWHDLIVGSVVVEVRPKRPGLRGLVRAGACACLLGFSSLWTWEYLIAADYYRNMTIAYTHVGLQELAQLQEIYRRRTGRYADNLLSLAAVSGDAKGFMLDMGALFDPKAGIRIRATSAGYRIDAKSRDVKSTPVSLIGPQTG